MNRLRRLGAHVVATAAIEGAVEDEEAAFARYCHDGERRALALGNRGPFHRDADGRVARDIIEAYRRTGFYVLESLVDQEELRELRDEFETLLDNAPVREDDGVNVAFVQRQKDHGEEFDRHGRPVRYPFAYAFTKTLSDPSGGTDALGGRHQMKMRELTPAAGLPTRTIANLTHYCGYMDSGLRLYGHPDLMAIAEEINGPDFTPFTENAFYKEAGAGAAVAWHQDPNPMWDEPWREPGFDVTTCGFSFHLSLYECTAQNGLWMLPGSASMGRVDINALAAAGGDGDRLPGAVPILCKPGDCFVQNRLALHGSFPNVGSQRCTLQFGFHKRASVLGLRTQGTQTKGRFRTYDSDYIERRSKLIALAIDARRQRWPDEKQYVYRPLAGREDELGLRWDATMKDDPSSYLRRANDEDIAI